MQRQFFSGNTVEQAIMSAARHFEVEPDRLAYRLRDKKHGFLNARKRVVIEVDPASPALSNDAVAAAPTYAQEAPRAPRSESVPPRRAIEADEEVDAAPVHHDDDDDGQRAFGLGIGQTPRPVPAAPRREGRPPRGGREDRRPERGVNGRAGANDRGGARAPERGTPPERGGNGRAPAGRGPDAGPRGRFDGRPSQNRGAGAGSGGGVHRDGNRDGRRRGGDRPHGDRSRGDRPQGNGQARRRGGFAGSGERRLTGDFRVVDHLFEDGDWRALEGEGSQEMQAFEIALELILEVMDLDIEYTVTEGDPFLVEFSGEDGKLLVAEDGKVLKAIEHVLPRVVRTLVGEAIACKVDCEDFQASHEKELVELAERTAEEVRRLKKAKLLPPMNPADRRIIHVALMEDSEVDTASEGDGFIKRIRVSPVRI
jgi:predicted RNA-binding protein Jag